MKMIIKKRFKKRAKIFSETSKSATSVQVCNCQKRPLGVADSNGRRSVSRLLRGSYVNMETGSWNPVLDSTYDSNQRGQIAASLHPSLSFSASPLFLPPSQPFIYSPLSRSLRLPVNSKTQDFLFYPFVPQIILIFISNH